MGLLSTLAKRSAGLACMASRCQFDSNSLNRSFSAEIAYRLLYEQQKLPEHSEKQVLRQMTTRPLRTLCR